MIKYLGSKRRLVPLLERVWDVSGAKTGLDLFAGTTRVAQAFKRRGGVITAVDSARYAHLFARTYVEADADHVDRAALEAEIRRLDELPGVDGYVSDVFCAQARYFHPDNGRRIDAIRAEIAEVHAGSWMEPLLLTSLIEAADRVDSTTGVQMAYLKRWAARALKPMSLRAPELLAGSGRAIHADAVEVADSLGGFDLAYLDPPYNQHRYTANYHVWETLAAGDEPEAYGVARKRSELRERSATSVFNRKREMPSALRAVIGAIDARLVVVSYNDESWLSADELIEMGRERGATVLLGVESERYVGAKIGVHNPRGEKVGRVGRLRNIEYLLLCGDRPVVERAARAATDGSAAQTLAV